MATNNAINTDKPIEVAKGGTGAASLTANSLLLGNGTGAISSLGAATDGQIPIGSTGNAPVLATLTAGSGISITNGAGSITIGATISPGMVLIETQTVTAPALSVEFITNITSAYNTYLFILTNVACSSALQNLELTVSTDGGATWVAGTGYTSGVHYLGFSSTTYINDNVNAGDHFIITPDLPNGLAVGGSLNLWCTNITNNNPSSYWGQCTFLNNSTNPVYADVVAYQSTSMIINGFRFAFGGGQSIGSGIFSLYGITQ